MNFYKLKHGKLPALVVFSVAIAAKGHPINGDDGLRHRVSISVSWFGTMYNVSLWREGGAQ